jgi:hypothetical protein
MLFAEGGFLADVTALVAAVGGLIAAVVSLFKYLDERRKRKAAEHKLEELLVQVRQLCLDTAETPKVAEQRPTSDFHAQLEDILKQLNESVPHPR